VSSPILDVSLPSILETKFHVKPLPHARIPIVKLSLSPSPGLPLGIACDIGFENRLALENTRLLMCYAMIDPTRVRTMVLFREQYSRSGFLDPMFNALHIILCTQLKFGANGGQPCSEALTLIPTDDSLQEDKFSLQGDSLILWLCPSGHIFPCPCQESARPSEPSTNSSPSAHTTGSLLCYFFSNFVVLMITGGNPPRRL